MEGVGYLCSIQGVVNACRGGIKEKGPPRSWTRFQCKSTYTAAKISHADRLTKERVCEGEKKKKERVLLHFSLLSILCIQFFLFETLYLYVGQLINKRPPSHHVENSAAPPLDRTCDRN